MSLNAAHACQQRAIALALDGSLMRFEHFILGCLNIFVVLHLSLALVRHVADRELLGGRALNFLR